MYIYQRAGWPKFQWDREHIRPMLTTVGRQQSRLLGRMDQLGFRDREEASWVSLVQDVLTSSAIEGETLDPDQVRSSVARRLGIEVAATGVPDRRVDGVVEMMLDATQNHADPLTEERLCGWQAALFPTGFSGARRIIVGQWRTDHDGRMQVVSGRVPQRIHFEAPKAAGVPQEMAKFLRWFEADDQESPIVRAAIAHLWFVTIHPFEDGNGRVARALTDMVLARYEDSTQRFYSLSSQILKERKGYYAVLENTQRGGLDITAWLEWFITCLGHSFLGVDETLRAVLRRAKFWTHARGKPLNVRQAKVLALVLEGEVDVLTSTRWAKITQCSQDTALRDIQDLIRGDILYPDPTHHGRLTHYLLVSDR